MGLNYPFISHHFQLILHLTVIPIIKPPCLDVFWTFNSAINCLWIQLFTASFTPHQGIFKCSGISVLTFQITLYNIPRNLYQIRWWLWISFFYILLIYSNNRWLKIIIHVIIHIVPNRDIWFLGLNLFPFGSKFSIRSWLFTINSSFS